MAQLLRVFPELGASRQVVTLADGRFSLRLTWRERPHAWYADLYAADGTALWEGQRISTGWVAGTGLRPEGRPSGVLYVRGPAEYRREDLGVSVELVFYPTSELPLPEAEAFPVTITV